MPRYYKAKEDFKIITAGEISPYLDKAPDRDCRFTIALAWLTGARIQEIVNLRREHFKVGDGKLTINNKALKHGRVGYPTFSFEDPFIQDIIIPYIQDKGGRILTRTTTRRYQQMLRALNQEIHGSREENYIVFHQLRHSRTTYLARVLEASPEELKSWFGHRSVAFEEYFAPRKVERFRGRIR